MLIKAINDRQNLGDIKDCLPFLQRLQQNLLQLAALADAQTAPQTNPTNNPQS